MPPAGAAPDLRVRPATAADLPGLLALLAQLNPEDAPPDLPAAAAALAAGEASGLVTVLVVEIDGTVGATCTLVVVPNLTRGTRPWAVVENVVTDAGHRRQGLGRKVLQAALDRAWAAGCYKVMLATGSQRQGTLLFYEAAGFIRGEKTFFQARRDQSGMA
ncbi:GNAT family N-acetyltransferase [Roseomonas sp. 18066]|uniref:GNAT family N-acetyltransferase n=1 Tax=Roseomonas sp. 18066 TaxID=2681412 RepID=UPI001F17921D|nr:GNAT family N-acetyltransferase [Roseomonas sp. 18066]